MTATLPWLNHLSRYELELLVTELVRDLEQRPASVERSRAQDGLGSWRVIAESYGAVADGDEPATGGPAAG